MTDKWLLKSETYDNCNCAINCGCQFNLPSTHSYCQSAFIGKIVEGHFNDTRIAGLNWAALYKWPGEIAEGNGKRQIVIDERGDEAQRTALETIVSGGACKPDLAVNFELRTAKVDIPGVMTSTGKPIINPSMANRSTLPWHGPVGASSSPMRKSDWARPR
jgi:hypothetical protein